MPSRVILFGVLILAVSLTLGMLVFRTGGRPAHSDRPSALTEPLPPALNSKVPPELVSGVSGTTDRTQAPTPSAPDNGPAAAETRVVSITGRLVTARGEPIAGARVFVAPEDRLQGAPIENLDPQKVAWVRRMDTSSDAGGAFHLDGVPAGTLRLATRNPGRAPYDTVIGLTQARNDVGEIVMQDSVLLSGHVLDRARSPVSGASLRRLKLDANPAVMLSDASGDTVAITDEHGAFHIDELKSGPWSLMIKAAGHPDRIESGTTATPGQVVSGLEFVLDDGAVIEGRVVNAPPELIADLWVTAVPIDERGSTGRTAPGEQSDPKKFLVVPRNAPCAADGRFTVAGLTADTQYRLAARKGEHDALGRVSTTWVEARAGQRNVELQYQLDVALVFQAVDAQTTQPITTMEVRVGKLFMLPLFDEKGQVKRSFPEGRVRFENIFKRPLEEQAELVIEARGYTTLRVGNLRPVSGSDLDLGVLRLDRAPIVRVRVVDAATSKPIVNARVVLTRQADDRSDPGTSAAGSALQEAVTQADGRVELNSLPGETAVLTVSHSDYAPERSSPIVLARTGDREETIALKQGGRVLLTVTDALGATVRGERIEHGRLVLDGYVKEVAPDFVPITNAKGEVRFEHLAAGTHRFAASTGLAHFVTVAVGEGGEHTATLVLPQRARVTGRVTEGGQPLSGATLRFASNVAGEVSNPGGARTARTNGDGEYALEDVDLSVYRVSVVHPARAMSFECDSRIEAAVSRFDVDLPLAAIDGRILDENGKPVEKARIRVESALAPDAPGDAIAVSDPDGKYVLQGVRPAVQLVIVVNAGDYQPLRSEPLTVAAGEVKTGVDLRLAAGAALEVSVTNADGRSALACRVRATSVADARVVTATTNAAGRASFRGLQPGVWRVRAESTTPSPEVEVDVKRDVANSAALQLR